MKRLSSFISLLLLLILSSFSTPPSCYSGDYVEISEVDYENDRYSMVLMRRTDDRVKAKYFAARDFQSNSSVYERYQNWKKTNRNVILASCGTYMDKNGIPVGLTIDNGIVVNKTLIKNEMDALTIVYATGGIAVSNLKDGNLTVSGINRKLDLRNNTKDLYDFIKWAEEQEATVFQTHLLVYKNQLTISTNNSNRRQRERRFLAVGKDENGEIVHLIIQRPGSIRLSESAERTLRFLNEYKYIDVIFMINLDVGSQDVFDLYNSNCTINTTIKGQLKTQAAVNLLIYHFK